MTEYSFDTDHLKVGLKRRAVRGSGVTIISQIVSFFIQFAGTMILARILTPEDFGLIAMVTTFSLLLQNFGVSGFTEAIIQSQDFNNNKASTLFWINGGISLSLTFFFILCAPVIAWFYGEPRLIPITAVIAISICSSGFSTIHLALLKRRMQFNAAAVITMVSKAFSVGLTIVLALLGTQYWALVVNVVALPLFMAILAWLACGWRPGRPHSRKEVLPMVKYAMHTYGNFTLHYFSRNLDNLLVGKFLGIQSLGFYKKAYDLFALSASQIAAPLSNVAVSALSRIAGNREIFLRYYLNAISVLAFIGMALSLFLTVGAKDIILLILGPNWGRSAELFLLFGPGVGLLFVYGTHTWIHLSIGRADRLLRWGILEFIITAALIGIGACFGLSYVALAWTVSLYLLTVPGIYYAGKPIQLTVPTILSAIWRFLMAAAVAGLLSWFVLFFWPITAGPIAAMNVFLRLTLKLVMTMSSYVLLTTLFYGSLKPLRQVLILGRELLPGGKRDS